MELEPIRISLIFAAGTAFFVGLGLVLLVEGLLFKFRNRIARPALTVVAIVGIILVILSATPLPIWAYGIWTITAVVGLALLNRTTPARRLCVICGTVLASSTLALCLAEAPFHRRPVLPELSGSTVYVIGDSISAQTGTEIHSWPAVLNERTSLRVVNLAQPGATVESGIAQAKVIPEMQSFVIVNIGGNDLLGGMDADTFHSKLNSLVSSLRSSRHDVLLLELPLFPFQNAYGKAQRDVVRKYGIAMLPKRFFSRVLGSRDGTVDGLHLSQAGHDAMAEIIANVLNTQ